PAGAGPDFVGQLAERLRNAGAPTAPFNRRLVRHRGVLTWLEDDEFDPEQHLVHLTLPRPGRPEQLVALAARLHGVHLDRAFPLWRMYLIGGLADGRVGLYCKVHHALADGMAATRLWLQSMSPEPLADLPPPWAPPAEPRKAHAPAPSVARRLVAAARSVPVVWDQLQVTAREIGEGDEAATTGHDAPATIFNQRVSSSRQLAVRSFALSRVRNIGRALGSTTNDVVLALCGAALRGFLLEVRALPDTSLIAMVPMSVREPGDRGAGNRIVPLLVRLGTDIPDPLYRLRTIRRSAEREKARCRGLSMGEIYAYLLATTGVPSLRLLLHPSSGRLPFNVVISNINGASGPMYWQGCKLDTLYPMSVVVDGLALNITFASRGDSLDFGVVACRRSLPQMSRLLDHLEHALAELETLIPQPESVPLGDGLHEIRVPRRHKRAVHKRRAQVRAPIDTAAAAPAANDAKTPAQADRPAV
ncbi:MAG TPA: wax ester/triacylglycerol synthase family O-acyltransferase, partial [Nevskiaceae bacterium]|nr:wax ester/triacylglycerol synthase family O-acyltransferase [Nevskiaceae bacterium]